MKVRVRVARLFPGDGLQLVGPVNVSLRGGAGQSPQAPGVAGSPGAKSVGGAKPPPAHKPSPRKLQVDAARIKQLAAQAGVSELHYADASITIDIDGSGVKLTNLASGAYAKIYTTGVIGYTKGTVTVTIDDSGVVSADSSTGLYSKLLKDQVLVKGAGSASTRIDEDGVFVTNGTHSVTINYDDITHSLALRELDYCDAGVAKKMLVLASAPYT